MTITAQAEKQVYLPGRAHTLWLMAQRMIAEGRPSEAITPLEQGLEFLPVWRRPFPAVDDLESKIKATLEECKLTPLRAMSIAACETGVHSNYKRLQVRQWLQRMFSPIELISLLRQRSNDRRMLVQELELVTARLETFQSDAAKQEYLKHLERVSNLFYAWNNLHWRHEARKKRWPIKQLRRQLGIG